MTYVLRSDHPEALHDGRVIGRGTQLSDSAAQKNPRLIERGVLVKEPERHKPPRKQPEPKAGHDTAAAPQKKEESK